MSAHLIDLTLKVSPSTVEGARENLAKARNGHIGTHFDAMDKEFPVSYMELPAIVFDVEEVGDNTEIQPSDIDVNLIPEGGAVLFKTRYIERVGYGTKVYFTTHPQLSKPLIELLVQKRIAIIAVDFSGVRCGREHTEADQYCADHGTFIVENICNLTSVLQGQKSKSFTLGTYPVNFTGLTGLPCRVVAKV